MRLASKQALACLLALWAMSSAAQTACKQPVYLTFDTGHMGVAPLIAQILQRQKVQVTFFVAHEKTQEGDGTLGVTWGPWWAERAKEGHEFASHTHDHVYWQSDDPSPGVRDRFLMRPSAGRQAGHAMRWTAAEYCENLQQATARIEALTGRPSLPVFRAPGGKTSAKLLAAAKACGYAHVGWAPAGFLGDELSSEQHSNAQLLGRALRNIRPGDVLMAHLGIWSRKDPWAPTVLEPLIVGLKAKGYCFASLRDHPDLKSWIFIHSKTQ